ncbi:AraC-like DNA-binding protein [Tamaricihabitans halophyticus]|uniref:AraC-like DNA-binding protein n=1 Tax=Tamaricihabitans halophyticus TaxID=1262583 RepID=A0A4R2QMV7_9PSEU|nr:helix-turn-helix domain-containing protein [Tamaricihabitans halophyticus]TCP50910.1 AraC-like DNA-binding protein [Tamaricihabitans halophyticus]
MDGPDQGDGWEFAHAKALVPDAVVSAVGYRSDLPAPAVHLGAPSPAVTLVLTLDEPIAAGSAPEDAFGPAAQSTHVALGGLHTQPVYLAQPRVQTGVQLAVRPLAVRALFGISTAELRQRQVDGRDVLGIGAELVRERMSEAGSWSERFAVLDGYLRGLLDRASTRCWPRPEVAEAWQWIAHHRGTGSIGGLARHVRLSERQLSAVFTAEFGLSPKAVSRLMRFEHARQRVAGAVRAGGPLNIADTAYACGYADHSHLVRDFHQYLGIAPSEWVAHERRNIQAGAAQPAQEFWS